MVAGPVYFSFGHYFDPKLLGYASLRVLNRGSAGPGYAFQPRTYPKVDTLNVILDGEAEYRGSPAIMFRPALVSVAALYPAGCQL